MVNQPGGGSRDMLSSFRQAYGRGRRGRAPISSGRTPFGSGSIPQGNATAQEVERNERPPTGTIGRPDIDFTEMLPSDDMFRAWAKFRRYDFGWDDMRDLANHREDVKRAGFVSGDARHTLVRMFTRAYQIPRNLFADRFGCHSQLEAAFVAVFESVLCWGQGNVRDCDLVEHIVESQLHQGRFDYKHDQRPVPRKGSGLSSYDKGARLEHRLVWLCALVVRR